MKIARIRKTITIPKNDRIMFTLKSSLLADKKFLFMAVIIFVHIGKYIRNTLFGAFLEFSYIQLGGNTFIV